MVSSQTAVDSKKEPLDFEKQHFPAGAGMRREEVLDTAVLKLHTYNIPANGLCPGAPSSPEAAQT